MLHDTEGLIRDPPRENGMRDLMEDHTGVAPQALRTEPADVLTPEWADALADACFDLSHQCVGQLYAHANHDKGLRFRERAEALRREAREKRLAAARPLFLPTQP